MPNEVDDGLHRILLKCTRNSGVMPRALEQAEQAIRTKYTSRKEYALLQADLAWCLGKLRGLGHPAEEIEKRRELGLEENDERQDSTNA